MSSCDNRDIILSMLQKGCEPSPEDSYTTLAVYQYEHIRNVIVYKLLYDFNNVLDFINTPYVKPDSRKLIWERDHGLTEFGKTMFPEIEGEGHDKQGEHSIRVGLNVVKIGKKLEFKRADPKSFHELFKNYFGTVDKIMDYARIQFPYFVEKKLCKAVNMALENFSVP